MNIPIVVLIGSVLGALGAAGIYFEPREPYKHQIVTAGTIRGILVALLTGLSMSSASGWFAGLGLGGLYGALFGVVIYLAKGGSASGDAPLVIPVSATTGALSGLLIVWLAL
ncbi:MAG TPA: hypothetical protein VGA22_10720 [Gemmatimonadales bacterium]